MHAIAGPFRVAGTYGLTAEDVPIRQCPEQVLRTIRGHVGTGRIDEVKTVRMENRFFYLAEIDLPGERERMLQVGGDGTLMRIVDEVRLGELPRSVKSALAPFLTEGSAFGCAERVTGSDQTVYCIDLGLVDDVDLHLVLGEHGEILRRYEEGDF